MLPETAAADWREQLRRAGVRTVAFDHYQRGCAKVRVPRSFTDPEAILINTAGGLVAAISGIVAYNFFTTKVDNFTYMIDEASYSIVQMLASRKPSKR